MTPCSAPFNRPSVYIKPGTYDCSGGAPVGQSVLIFACSFIVMLSIDNPCFFKCKKMEENV